MHFQGKLVHDAVAPLFVLLECLGRDQTFSPLSFYVSLN